MAMDSTNFDTFDSPAGGVELSDNLNDWRKKTNGIIQKITSLQAEVDSGDINDNAIVLKKLEQIANLKVLGNTSGSSANVSEISILDQDTLSSNSATALATQQSIKAYVDNNFFDGQIVQQKTYRYDTVHDTGATNTFNLQTSGTYNNMWLATGNSGAPDILSEENFSRDGTSAATHNAAEVPVRVTVTPKFSSSLLCIEWHVFGEPTAYNTGFLIGRHRSDGKVEVINDTGYEGYNSSIQTQRNNYYSAMFWDDDNSSTAKTVVVRYFIPAVNTNERTYTIIFSDPASKHKYSLNRVVGSPGTTDYRYEHGVSTATIQELYQE